MIAAEMEEVIDRLVRRQESLRLPRGLEPLHLALSPPGGLVRIFGPVVQPLVPAVLDRWQEILLCRGIAGELVRDHHPRRSSLPLQELAKQPLGGFRITPALNQNVEHDAVLIDGAPQPVRRPGDLDDDLSRCHLSPARGWRRRISFANPWPNFSAHCRTVS